MKKIIILGANGMLGNYLDSYLDLYYHVMPFYRNGFDFNLKTESEIKSYIEQFTDSNTVIINACGIIKQRNYNISEMIKINGILPHILATIKKDTGCEVIHITTDCVFSGDKINGYNEGDKHDATDFYGKSKSIGESEFLTNIRTSIIGEEKLNKKSLLEWVRSNKNGEIDGYTNHIWNGVTCYELAKQIHNIIDTGNFWCGVRHVYSPETVSKFELVNIINSVYELNIKINPIQTRNWCVRILTSKYETPVKQTISEQIRELKKFKLRELK